MANGRHVGTDAAVLNVIDCTDGIMSNVADDAMRLRGCGKRRRQRMHKDVPTFGVLSGLYAHIKH